MPVEIRELIIRAVVRDAPEEPRGGGGVSEADREDLIRECVRQVLRVLEKAKER